MANEFFESIKRGAQEAVAHNRGRRTAARVTQVKVPDTVNVKAIRRKLGMSQSEFSKTFGFGIDAVKSWEIKRREPEKSARILLKIIEKNPKAVLEATA